MLVVVAHYDDESIGASHILFRHRAAVRLLHITDSAPLDLRYARRAGFPSREAYSRARRREMLAAVAVAGVQPAQCRTLPIPDLEATRHLHRIAQAIRRFRPAAIYTHAYEGGHPDHDACAVACRLALARLPGARLYEMPFYHNAGGTMQASRFIDGSSAARRLSPAAIRRRRAMFAHHVTQAHVFERFTPDLEPVRKAPLYDFAQPPHAGTLYYETRPMGWTFATWRAAVQQQLEPS